MAKVLELQHQSFPCIFRTNFLQDGLVGSPCCQRHSQEFSSCRSVVSVAWHSTVFMVQLSHPNVTTEKTISLTRWTFVYKVVSLLFNMLPRFVTAFLPRSKGLLTSWLQSLSTVIWEPKKIKPATVYIFPPSICHEVMGPEAMTLIF